MSTHIAAIDLGASSGRVILGIFDEQTHQLNMEEIYRFDNYLIERNSHFIWDIDAIYNNILIGLNKIVETNIKLDSIGIDSWGVDFVALDPRGNRVGPAVSYRDNRTDSVVTPLLQKLGASTLYSKTGIQFLKFNTVFQMKALMDDQPGYRSEIARILMIPDYLHYLLSHEYCAEYTNASTTQLLNAQSRQWDASLLDAVHADQTWFPSPVEAGTRIGNWISPRGDHIPVIVPATHDTAAAIVATPLQTAHSAYISSGTWSLVGIESDRPFLSPAAEAANLTNEGGVEGTYRVLKNVMGLWLIQGIHKIYPDISYAQLAEAAAAAPGFRSLINPNDDLFMNPPSMVDAIRQYCDHSHQPIPQTPGELARCVLDSLALYYRQVIQELETVAGFTIDTIHIVGGGSQNHVLNQLCADICQKQVQSGPIEASAIGNIGMQLKGLHLLANRQEIRDMVRKNMQGRSFAPRPIAGLSDYCQQFEALAAVSDFSRFHTSKDVA